MVIGRVEYSKLYQDWLPGKYLLEPEKPDTPTKALSELVEINPASRILDRNMIKAENRVIEIGSVDSNGKVVNPKIYKSEEISRKIRLRAYKNDILISVTQVKEYTPVLVPEDKMLVSDNYAVLVFDENPYYMFWALSHKYVQKQIKARARGTVIQRIPQNELLEIEIPWLREKERDKKIELIKDKFAKISPEEEALVCQEKINSVMKKRFQYNPSNMSKKVIEKVSYQEFSNSDNWNIDLFLIKDIERLIHQSEKEKIHTLDEITSYICIGVNVYRFKGGDTDVGVIKSKNLGVLKLNGQPDTEKINDSKIKELNPGDLLMRRKGGVGPVVVVSKEQEECTFDDTLVQIVVDLSLIHI